MKPKRENQTEDTKLSVGVTAVQDVVREFPSFDILWFDIQSKVREMMIELNKPLIDKIFAQKEAIGLLEKQAE